MITELINGEGDGVGRPLSFPWGVATDGNGNVYVAGQGSNKAFRTTPAAASVDSVLENPGSGSSKSGIGLISGWVCPAGAVVVEVDGIVVATGYGTSREDTRSVCGDADNGLGALVNWNLFWPGPHTARALAAGVEFSTTSFIVSKFGEEFLTGVSGTYTVEDFPQAGTDTQITWEQASQNFVITVVE